MMYGSSDIPSIVQLGLSVLTSSTSMMVGRKSPVNVLERCQFWGI